jgi:GNAT superfamily N-acetyltransferase
VLAAELGGRWQEGGWLTERADGVKAQIAMRESRFAVVLESVLCVPQGRGLGTALILALRAYADRTGKELRVEEIENTAFFERFEFWTDYIAPDEDGNGEASYHPRTSSSVEQ